MSFDTPGHGTVFMGPLCAPTLLRNDEIFRALDTCHITGNVHISTCRPTRYHDVTALISQLDHVGLE